MGRPVLFICVVILVIHIPVVLFAQTPTNGDYRSFTTNGSWGAPGSWQKFVGTTWVIATTAPYYNDGVITVSEGHTIVVNDLEETDQTTIKAGGTVLVLAGKTLMVFSGAGDDLTNQGNINNIGTIKTAPVSGVIVINNQGIMANLIDGTVDIGAGMRLLNSATFNNSDLVKIGSNGKFLNLEGGTITNNGNSGKIEINSATFENRGTTNQLLGSTISGTGLGGIENWGTLKNEGTIDLTGNAGLYNYLDFTHKGYIGLQMSIIINYSPGICQIEGTIDVNAQTDIDNRSYFKNMGIINFLTTTSTLKNEGQFENKGPLNFQNGAKLDNKLTFTNPATGTITMSGAGGKFTNANTASFTNTGPFTINSPVQPVLSGTLVLVTDLVLNP